MPLVKKTSNSSPNENAYTIEFANENARQELIGLPMSIRQKAFALLDRMKIFGPSLGMPHTRAMGDGLFEVRATGQEGIGRVLYCTQIGRMIVVLHCFVKKSQKTPKKELDIAITRKLEFENEQTSENI